ncbi:MAG: PBP1A family penicillin-binding protein [Spirochaetes bacterium]|nr:PBP1A family penicillin-binding protein [Spirochaetota bacterium]
MTRYKGKKTRFSPGGLKTGSTSTPAPLSEKAGIGRRIGEAVKRLGEGASALTSRVRDLLPKALPRIGDAVKPDRALLTGGGSRRFAMPGDFRPGGIAGAAAWVIDRASSLINALLRSPAAMIGIGTGLLLAFGIILAMDFGRVQSLAHFQPNMTTKIFDRHGVLVSELFSQKREVVPYRKIPANLVNAFIAMEDNEFYDHWGINPKGITRAFFINIFSGRIRQGGSTITQQLAKVLLTSGRRNIYRKVKEAFIAVMMEFTYSKDEIMGLYLNQIFMGHGTYGVEAAAMLYFEKHVWQLDLAECALLATLPAAPNQYSPIRHPKRSISRHKIALARMVEMGFITVPQAERAFLAFWPDYLDYLNEISPTMTTMSARTNRAPWFTEHVRRHLVKKYGRKMVYEEGLQVYTTIDLKKQLAAQDVLKRKLEQQTVTSGRLAFKNEDYIVDTYSEMVQMISFLFDMPPFRRKGSQKQERLNSFIRDNIIEELEGLNLLVGIEDISHFLEGYKSTYLEDKQLQKVEGCLVSIDHRNGFVEAMVGGSEFTSINQLNRVMQSKRQPGSAIKPLIYAAAIESGDFNAATAVLDSPVVFLDSEAGDWIPENYEREYSGFVRLRKALALSINVVSIRVSQQLGIGYVMEYLAKLLRLTPAEAKSRIPRNLSIALGSVEVSPLELATAYAIIANGGKNVIPFTIRQVKDRDGNILENREEEVAGILREQEGKGAIQVIKPETAQVMISMMQSVISGGTGGAANPGRPAAGKTGTTNNWKDAWFVGFTPEVTTGIWVGYDKMGLSLGIGQAGGGVAAPIWGEYMRLALKDEPVQEFPQYAPLITIDVCEESGMLPAPECRSTISEIFVPGAVPEKTCDMCAGIMSGTWIPEKGPAENILRDQKRTIRRQMEKKEGSIIEHIDDDLLE